MNFLIASLIGLASGVASGLFGVGGGIVMVPAMLYLLSPPIRDIKQAVGTSLIVIIPTALMGGFRHQASDNVHWRVALWLIPGAVVGSWLGVWLVTHQLSNDSLKRLFGCLLVVVGARLLLFKN
jgi:hypothetical protein